ncbi:hypothetical protein [Plantactinospora sp. B24E8]
MLDSPDCAANRLLRGVVDMAEVRQELAARMR